MPNKEVAMKTKSFLYIYTHAIEGEKEKAAIDRKTTLSISPQSVFFLRITWRIITCTGINNIKLLHGM